ncbi:hypothetical protein ACIQUL_35795 [Streptomyces sp. NPDC090303]|uniref:hypothetical protein n=1 Tax=Streptomyces sp. NPDC090303 TaxID=3365960 RepID=UPI003824703E
MSIPPPEWSAPARQLWHAMRAGIALDLTSPVLGTGSRELRPPGDLEITAEVVGSLLLHPPPPEPGVVSHLHLIGATITGRLRLSYATVEIPLTLVDCQFANTPELNDASLRAVDLTGSRFPGLDADRLKVEGDLVLRRATSGTISLVRADVAGDMWLTGAELTAEGTDHALHAPQLRVGGGLYARSVTAKGGLNLWGAQAFTVEVAAGRLSHPTHAALRCDGLRLIQDLMCTRLSVDSGGLSLFGAAIGGQCWFNDADVHNATGWAINAPSVRVGGGVYGRGMTAQGGINLFAAAIGESLELPSCTLTAYEIHALRAPGARIEGSLKLDNGAKFVGDVSLPRTEVKATLRLSGSTFTRSTIIDLNHATLGALDMASLNTLPSVLDLRAATIGRINDSTDSWPPRVELDGLAYQDLRPVLPADKRLAWLNRGDSYNPLPHERLAAYYRQLGHDDDARAVQLARHRQRRRYSRPLARLWGHLEDLTVGYGYRPGRAFASLFALTAAVALVFTAVPPQATRVNGPDFQPVAFALDLVLPVLDLGQEKSFIPSTETAWVAWTGAVAGWLLATTVIAGLTRRLSRASH